jgi:hypothetical protein
MEVSTSPKDGNGNPTVFCRVEATATVANSWQVLTFDLTSFGTFKTTNAYDRVILFPDFNVSGTEQAIILTTLNNPTKKYKKMKKILINTLPFLHCY